MSPPVPIRVAARRAGLKPQVVRSWERRYGVVRPLRTEGNRRSYTEGDIDRLTLLRRATESGYRIGEVAGLSHEQLLDLARPAGGDDSVRVRCLSAIDALDDAGLRVELETAWMALGRNRAVDEVLLPLFEQLAGDELSGTRRLLHRQFLEEVVSGLMEALRAGGEAGLGSPLLILASPLRQRRSAVLKLLAAIAEGQGWRTLVLGTGLPSEDVAHAARARDAGAVLLSCDSTVDPELVGAEVNRLRRMVGGSLRLWITGDGSRRLADTVDPSAVEFVEKPAPPAYSSWRTKPSELKASDFIGRAVERFRTASPGPSRCSSRWPAAPPCVQAATGSSTSLPFLRSDVLMTGQSTMGSGLPCRRPPLL